MQLYFSFNLAVTIFLCFVLVIVGSGFSFIDQNEIPLKHWIVLISWTGTYVVLSMAVLIPTSYINKQSLFQVRRLITIRESYVRLVRDPKILEDNPLNLRNKIQRIGLRQLLEETKGLYGEKSIDKMHELACEVYESLSDAIEKLQADIEFNPRQFLGISLFPDQLWSAFLFITASAFGLLQDNFSEQ